MKKKVIKLTKIWFWVFIAMLLVLVGFMLMQKSDTVAIPTILGVAFLIALVGMLILFVIVIIMDAIDSWKRDKKTYILGFVAAVAATTAVLMVLEYFLSSHTWQIKESFAEAFIIICGIRAGEYIRNNK